MERKKQEAVIAFGEILCSTNTAYSHNAQNRILTSNNRLMIYFQSMKFYIPEGFQPDTLLKLLQTMKKL